jgi:glycosyltransferase involved in cell wall biosynthesis
MKNESMIKVSIILPVYNVGPYINQCLDSLTNQTMKEIEIILVNDCSTDNSGIICDEYARRDARIKVINNEANIRQGLCRNKGLEIARGEYVAFADPDDWMDLDFYEKLYSSANSNHSDIAKTEARMVYPDGRVIKQSHLNKIIRKGLKNGLPIFQLFTYEHWTAIFKRSIIVQNNVKYPHIRNAEDIVFLLQMTYFSNSISLISGTNYYYRQRNDSTVAIQQKPYFDSFLEYFALHLDFINNHEMSVENYNHVFLRCYNNVKKRYREIDGSDEWKEYRQYYVKRVFEIMLEYKYDQNFILEGFYQEYTYFQRLTEMIRLTFRKISYLFGLKPNKRKAK